MRVTRGVFAAAIAGGGMLGALGTLRAFAAPGRQAAAQKGAASTPTQQIGDVSIGGKSVTATVEQNAKKGVLDVDLKGQPVVVTSARYDLTAPHVVLKIRNSLVSTGEATGGVDVAVRNSEKQNTTLRCARATYVGASSATAGSEARPPHLHLTGPVHSTVRDPQLAKPLETTAASADIDFLPDGTNHIVMTDSTFTGTPIEPEPAPGNKTKPGKKATP